METLRLKPRKPVEDDVENWDDDDFLIDGDDLALRNPSAMVSAPPHRRDSLSSHVSVRSELESVQGEDERVVHLPGEDEKSTSHAIAVAATAGIPIPSSVPSTALAGTIKRLGGRKVRKILQEDWGDDLELPDGGEALRIKTQDPNNFPQALRQVSSSHPSPAKPLNSPPVLQPAQPSKTPMQTLGPPINLERFKDRDDDDDDDLFGDGSETIKVSKTRQLLKPALPRVAAKMPEPHGQADNDYEQDLELPSDGTLKLSSRRDIPKTPVSAHDDFDWGEGSLGTRFGGTRRDGRSNRSSSASAFSPSISSSITAESEDEAQLDGIELPHGPLDLKERLRRKRQNRSPERTIEEEPAPPPRSVPQPEADTKDFFLDLNVGDGSVFDSGKLKLHTNVKLKSTRPTSPVRPKTAVSLTFTNKPVQTTSRLPRPTSSHHEWTHTQPSLEPVSESGGPIVSRPTRRSQSRLGHMSQSSQSSTASGNTPVTPSAPSFSGPTTPQKRQVGQKSSTVSLRNEPTTTNAQLLRLKRSLPAMRPPGSPARPMTGRGAERPPSRTESASRPVSGIRPKTPVDRNRHSFGEHSAAQARKPFLPAGGSSLQSYNVNAKRQLRRHDSDLSNDTRPTSRAVSRSTVRSPSPVKRDRKIEKLARAGVRLPLSLPKRPRHFGDGHELDAFDDLPTSAKTESEFVKQPKYPSPQYPTQFRNKVMQHLLPGRTNSPAPSSPHSPARPDYLPRFARDTASSRIAREANLAHRVPSSGPLAPLTSQRVAQLSTRSNLHQPQPSVKPKRPAKRQPQLKPHLIANLSSNNESKSRSDPCTQNVHVC